MKQILNLLLALALSNGANAQEGDARPSIIDVSDFAKSTVIGFLGVPMGRVVEIDATIISGDATRMKKYVGQYLLRVESIDGKRVESPRNFEFMVPAHLDAQVANDSFSLFELKYGNLAKSLDSNEIEILDKGYVGNRVRLATYEVGGFGGLPANLPPDVGSWASTGYHFSTHLVVLKRIAQKPNKTGRTKR